MTTPQLRLKALLDRGILAAWADGKVIQARNATTLEDWQDVPGDQCPYWLANDYDWRIKPEPPSWVSGEPPRVEDTPYLVWTLQRETVQWDSNTNTFRYRDEEGWQPGRFIHLNLKWWAPMCNFWKKKLMTTQECAGSTTTF